MAWKFGAMLGAPKFKENNEVHYNMNFVKFWNIFHKDCVLRWHINEQPIASF